MTRFKLTLLALTVLAALLGQQAYAHGFGERYDLPLPLTYFMVGGAAAVVLSFAFIGTAVRGDFPQLTYPRLNLLSNGVLRVVLAGPALLPAKLFAVFLLAMIIAAGLAGASRPVDNFAPTFIWVIWWVGIGFLIALFGNLWALTNPWKVLYGWAEGGYRLIKPDQELSRGWIIPERLGVWPAVALFFAFAWVENAYGGSDDPRRLAAMALVYTAITAVGMFLFGKHQWLRQGEAFSVVFGFISRFSITEIRVTDPRLCAECGSSACYSERPEDGCVDCYECLEYAEGYEFNLRPPAVGLNQPGRVGADVIAMVLLLLATVTFDGFAATPEWLEVQSWFLVRFPGLTREWLNGVVIANTIGLIGFPLAFAGVYWAFNYLIHRAVARQEAVDALAGVFVFSLIPIALAYNFAHFLSFLLIQGQQLIPLVSDPFGSGWDLFGTAGYLIDIKVTNARFIWFFSLAVIVIGHMIAVFLAHLRAMLLFRDQALVLKSQLPMLALMVIYTIVSLWIVSRPIVA